MEPGGRIRLRIINAAAGTNFLLDLGTLQGGLIAVDGNPIVPIPGSQFDLAIAQRLDIRLALPAGQGAYPLLARREADTAQTGIVLATKTAPVSRVSERAHLKARPLDLDLEARLVPLVPLAVLFGAVFNGGDSVETPEHVCERLLAAVDGRSSRSISKRASRRASRSRA